MCIATSGPGASHLVTGLYDARLDHMPVLAICGQQARTALGGHYQQEVDLPALLKDVAGAYVQTLTADRPVVIDFKTDPDVPPLPPRITLNQAKAFASSLIKGDPDEGRVILNTARATLASLIPSK